MACRLGSRRVKADRGERRSPPRSCLRCGCTPRLKAWAAPGRVERLTQAHDAYRWICGGVQVNYHTLADFRVGHARTLDELLSDSVASLMAAGVVKLKRVA